MKQLKRLPFARLSRAVSLVAVAAATTLSPGTQAQTTLPSLLEELADRDRLATHPNGAYTQHQASSYDRSDEFGLGRLGAPAGFANVDCGNFIRKIEVNGRTEWVMLEDKGPGVITRWWSTAANDPLLRDHHYRVYIDGSDTPAIEATPEDLVGKDVHGFGPALNYFTPERGGNLYGPILYQESIRITWDGPAMHNDHAHIALDEPPFTGRTDEAIWYSINYRKLAPAPGSEVESYRADRVEQAKRALDRANQTLLQPTVTGDISTRYRETQTLKPGQVFNHRITGPAAIRRLAVRVTEGEPAAALRDVQLVLVFDGQTTCRVPLGAFFGNGWSESPATPYNPGRDYMRAVSKDGAMASYWVMPFADLAEVRLVNTGEQDVSFEIEIDAGQWAWTDQSMHFHVDLIEEAGIKTRPEQFPRWPVRLGDADFRFLTVRGKGVYVGDTMSIRNRSTGPGLGAWWGEGDEKIYTDYFGEDGDGSTAQPDHLGTGTEDYYGYSFGSGRIFTSPFVTQPIAKGNHRDDGSLTVNGRVRGLDAIPFNESLKFDMEVWKWREGSLDIGAVTYWYGTPGAVSLHTVADLAADFTQADTIPDTAGDGQWSYFACDKANPNTPNAELTPLAWSRVGDQGHEGYTTAGDTNNAPSISDHLITDAGQHNFPVQGRPGYHELAAQPGGNRTPYLVARWTAGPSSEGLINLSGIARNLAKGGDSVDFSLYINGKRVFDIDGKQTEDGQLPETYFDLDAQIKAGEHVDIVLGPNDAGDTQHDETMIRAIIRASRDDD